MKQRIKKLWIAALKGGEYKQTEGNLKDDVGYCCLGVLCDLHLKDTGDGEWEKSENRARYLYLGSGSGLSEEVKSWAGLKTLENRL